MSNATLELAEIKQLFGHDPQFKWRVSLLVFIQIASLFYLHNKSWTFLIFVGYFFGKLS